VIGIQARPSQRISRPQNAPSAGCLQTATLPGTGSVSMTIRPRQRGVGQDQDEIVTTGRNGTEGPTG
jgi:hypothetical protein